VEGWPAGRRSRAARRGAALRCQVETQLTSQIALVVWCLWHARRALTDDAQMSNSVRLYTASSLDVSPQKR